MKKLISLTSAAVAASALFAAPVVSDVVMTQVQDRTVVVNYTLAGEPGIVTVDVQTNGPNGWVSIGGEHLTHFAGDVNKKVEPGERMLTWKPRKAWQDNKVTENAQVVVSAWETNAPPDYMVVSLVTSGVVEFYTCKEAIPYGITNEMYKTDYLVMRKIPAANVRWRMGSPAVPKEYGRTAKSEKPHEVTLSEDYYIGIYEITQRQYQRIMNERPSWFDLEADYMTRPVDALPYDTIRGTTYSWPGDGHKVDPTSFMGKLRDFTDVDGFDLPTEAQWEFACRAGCGAALYNGQEVTKSDASDAQVNLLARHQYNTGTATPTAKLTPAATGGTAKVGSYLPNDWGLYDVLGNVWELCLDWYQESLDGIDAEKGPESGTTRVKRGGGWNSGPQYCRAAQRNGGDPSYSGWNNGLRVACTAGIR